MPAVAFDLNQFYASSVSGIPIVLPILLIVYAVKQAGVSGKALFFTSLGVGTVFGFAYQAAVTGIPQTYAGYFSFAVYGLTLGGLTSLLHEYLRGDVAGYVKKFLNLPDNKNEPDQKIG